MSISFRSLYLIGSATCSALFVFWMLTHCAWLLYVVPRLLYCCTIAFLSAVFHFVRSTTASCVNGEYAGCAYDAGCDVTGFGTYVLGVFGTPAFAIDFLMAVSCCLVTFSPGLCRYTLYVGMSQVVLIIFVWVHAPAAVCFCTTR